MVGSDCGQDALPLPLRDVLRGLPRMAVALSGGLDSRFLCHAARLCGCEVTALHARGPHVPPTESAAALDWARRTGLTLLTVDFDPLPLPEVARNDRQRCYACKRGLVAALRQCLAEEGLARLPLCDGSNADDLHAFRPGLRALAEAGVLSPLAEASLHKTELRALAAATGLEQPYQQARPCLLTRLAYGLAPDAATLARLAAAEAALAALPGMFCTDFRLRLTPAPELHLATLPEAGQAALRATLAAHGFAQCSILVEGQVSGFFDTPAKGRASA